MRLAEQTARNVLAEVGGRYLGSMAKGYGDRLAISPDSRWLAIAGEKQKLCLWDLRSSNPEVSKTVIDNTNDFRSFQFSGDGKWLINGGDWPISERQEVEQRTVRLWKLDDKTPADFTTPLEIGDPNIDSIQAYRVSPDGAGSLHTGARPDPSRSGTYNRRTRRRLA